MADDVIKDDSKALRGVGRKDNGAAGKALHVHVASTTSGSASLPTSTTATHSNVVSASADTLLLALNTSRKGAMFFNDADKVLYLKFGSGASATSYAVQIAAGGYFELPSPVFTGLIHGFWATGPTGSARVTELT